MVCGCRINLEKSKPPPASEAPYALAPPVSSMSLPVQPIPPEISAWFWTNLRGQPTSLNSTKPELPSAPAALLLHLTKTKAQSHTEGLRRRLRRPAARHRGGAVRIQERWSCATLHITFTTTHTQEIDDLIVHTDSRENQKQTFIKQQQHVFTEQTVWTIRAPQLAHPPTSSSLPQSGAIHPQRQEMPEERTDRWAGQLDCLLAQISDSINFSQLFYSYLVVWYWWGEMSEEPKGCLKTPPSAATVCSPCCHLARDTEVSAVVPPDNRPASFPKLWDSWTHPPHLAL